MSTLLLGEILNLGIGVLAIYRGMKTLRGSDAEFIAGWEEFARREAERKGVSEDRVAKHTVETMKKSTKSWRFFYGARAVAGGFVLLIAFAALVIYDLKT